MHNKKQLIIALFFVLVVISGCSFIGRNPKALDTNMISTAAMQTVQAVLTENVSSTQNVIKTQIATSSTMNTPEIFFATETKLPTHTPTLEDKASYINDISVADDTSFSGNEEFTKTWRLKNIGNTTWNTDYEVVFVSGNAMGGKAAYALPDIVKPGETIDISINLKTPEKDGEYTGNWILRNSRGIFFGLGNQADQTFWVKIKVLNYYSDDIPSEKYPFDFTAKLCDATWKSFSNSVRIPCETNNSSTDVYISVLNQPEFENKYKDNERTIKMHLSGDKDGWMQGFYDAYLVQDGDYFKTIVGCLEHNQKCDAVVSLDIRVNGGVVQNIGKWIEIYDGKVSSIDIPLEKYVGKNVEFILGISNRSDTSSDIFWLAPRIVK